MEPTSSTHTSRRPRTPGERARGLFTAEIDRGRISKDEDKGAERLWGILSAWFAGCGAPPPQCAQGAIWKTHGSRG